MKKINLLLLLLFSIVIDGMTQDYRLKLWPGEPPNKNTPPGEEKFYVDRGTSRYENISVAELFVYLPDEKKNTGAAVVICPGGGYRIEAIQHEGFMMAKYLKQNGIAGIVLKYRLPYGQPEIPLTDALQAIRYVRSKAEEWRINPERVGIAGSSAGGHLASTAGTHYDLGSTGSADPVQRLSSRPDFMLLLYPVISFDEEIGHMGTRQNLIGTTNDWKLASTYSNELHVDEKTPPAFLVLADDDKGVDPENSVRFYLALKKHNVPAEMHIFLQGGHGFGMNKINKPAEQWPDLFVQWMQSMKYIK